jgi:hypothetical protein
MNQPVNAKVFLESPLTIDTLIITNGESTLHSYQGLYDLIVLSDSLAPVKKNITLNPGINNLNVNLSYFNTTLNEEFEGSCCTWILNGPWTVVQDSTHNSQFITDSWSGNGFYQVNSDNNMSVSFPLNLFGYDDQDVYLYFEHSAYTEWDNDFVTVETSLDSQNWASLYKFAGITPQWQNKLISLNQFKNNDLYLRFRIKDGNGINPNHPDLTDQAGNWIISGFIAVWDHSQLTITTYLFLIICLCLTTQTPLIRPQPLNSQLIIMSNQLNIKSLLLKDN